MSNHSRAVTRRALAAFLLLGAPALGAQGDTTSLAGAGARKPAGLCWRPRPEAHCRSWLVTQLSFEKAIMATNDDLGGRFVATAGPMINRGPTSAWGLLASYSTDDPDDIGPLRVEGRYRKWLGSSAGIDVGLGLTQGGVYGDFDEGMIKLRGVTAGVGIEQGLIGVDARLDVMRGGGDTEAATYVGVRAGGVAGPAAAVALVAGFFALFAIAYSGG